MLSLWKLTDYMADDFASMLLTPLLLAAIFGLYFCFFAREQLPAFYDENKINELLADSSIIRNRRKIAASINNARVFIKIQKEYGCFYDYLRTFVKDVIYENGKTTSAISDELSNDLKRRGMRSLGSITVYSYLQAVGLINSHEKDCFLYKKDDRQA